MWGHLISSLPSRFDLSSFRNHIAVENGPGQCADVTGGGTTVQLQSWRCALGNANQVSGFDDVCYPSHPTHSTVSGCRSFSARPLALKGTPEERCNPIQLAEPLTDACQLQRLKSSLTIATGVAYCTSPLRMRVNSRAHPPFYNAAPFRPCRSIPDRSLRVFEVESGRNLTISASWRGGEDRSPGLVFLQVGILDTPPTTNVFAISPAPIDDYVPPLVRAFRAERGGPEGIWRFRYGEFCLVPVRGGYGVSVTTCSGSNDEASQTFALLRGPGANHFSLYSIVVGGNIESALE